MRKWPVLSGVLLLALAGGLEMLRHHPSGEKAGFRSAPPQDASLPEGGRPYQIPAEFLAVPPRSGPPSTYGALPTIKNEIYNSGPCEGGSLNEILSSHGSVWGYAAGNGPFESFETAAVYDLLARYLSCVGLARGDQAFCDYLPAWSSGGKDVGRSASPNFICRRYYTDVREAMKSGSSGACPADSQALCSAFLSRTEASCSALLEKLGASYCGSLDKARRRAAGGLTPEEVKEQLRKEDEERAAAESAGSGVRKTQGK